MLFCTYHGGITIRTTLNIDGALLLKAQQITGITEKTALVKKGLNTLIEQESARRLAQLGGSEPQLQAIKRQQPKSARS